MKSATTKIFYLIAMVYLGVNAFIYFVQNQTVTGVMSDVYMGASFLCAFLGLEAFFYMLMEGDGIDSDVTVEILGIPLIKSLWYTMLFPALGARIYFAYMSNHYNTGAESIWGYLWMLVSIMLILMSVGQIKVYSAKHKAQRQREKAEADRARAMEDAHLRMVMDTPTAAPGA